MALFAHSHPQLYAQLDSQRNHGIDVEALPATTDKILWWQCPRGHHWREPARQRTNLAAWKNGDPTACVLCEAPPGVLYSCGHRRNRPTNASLEIMTTSCDRCRDAEHVEHVLATLPTQVDTATRTLAANEFYWAFHDEAERIIPWWTQLKPLIEAYFVRMTSLYHAQTVVAGTPPTPLDSFLAACTRHVIEALDEPGRPRLLAVVDRYDPGTTYGHRSIMNRWSLPGNWGRHGVRELSRQGFDILDPGLAHDITDRIEHLNGARLTKTQRDGTTAPLEPDLSGRNYPTYPAPITPRIPPESARPHLRNAYAATATPAPQTSIPRWITVLRTTIGDNRTAPLTDPLGRTHLGYHPDLTTDELWERSRGVSNWTLDHIAASALLIIVHNGRVVLTGTITGVTFHPGGYAIIGDPDPHHPLVGALDPLHTTNPLGHGTVDIAAHSPRWRPAVTEVWEP